MLIQILGNWYDPNRVRTVTSGKNIDGNEYVAVDGLTVWTADPVSATCGTEYDAKALRDVIANKINEAIATGEKP